MLVDRTAAESPVDQLQRSASRTKLAASDEVPKKKDGRGRPRKDRTLEAGKAVAAAASGATPVASTPVF